MAGWLKLLTPHLASDKHNVKLNLILALLFSLYIIYFSYCMLVIL